MQCTKDTDYNCDEYDLILKNYRKLFANDKGLLKEISQCNQCMQSDKHGLLNNLVNDPFFEPQRTYEKLKKLKPDGFEGMEDFQNYTETDYPRSLEFSKKLRKEMGGLSIGLNPWLDWSLLQFGEGYDPEKHPCKLMIIGKDWYPLSQAAEPPLYRAKFNYCNFFEALDEDKSTKNTIKENHILFTNAALCHRNGKEVSGSSNFKQKYIKNCRDRNYIVRLIKVFKPQKIITWGTWVAKKSWTLGDFSSLEKRAYDFKDLMKEAIDTEAKITIEGKEIPWLPLYHPSMGTYWSENDCDNLSGFLKR